MSKKGLTVSLDDFVKYLFQKWKIVLIFVVGFVVLFCVSAKIFGEKIVIAPSEEYFKLKEEEATIKDYVENAPLMKIDPVNVNEIIVYVSNITKYTTVKKYVDSAKIWKDFEDKNQSKYFWDIVTWEDTNDKKSSEIKIQHYDADYCVSMAQFLTEELHTLDSGIETVVGPLYISSDENIENVKMWYNNRLSAIEGQLEYERSGYTIETSMTVASITGIIFGCFVSICVLFVCFYIEQKKCV